jgi:type IV pilus assembly protein PilO
MAMNLSLSKMPWYGQIGAFVALSLAAAGVFWNWHAQPAKASIDQRRAQLETMKATIERGRKNERRLPEIRQQIAEREAQLERLRTVLPEEQDVADLLRRVQAMATQSNLTIRGFTPRAIAKKQMHMEWPIGLELEGSYHDLGDFLERISKFPRIINVGELHVVAREVPTGPTLTAELTATTFVLVETPAKAPAAAPAKAVTE